MTPPNPILRSALRVGAWRGYRVCLLGWSISLLASPLSAQGNYPPTTPRFRDVLRVAQEAYPDSARKLIDKMISSMSPNDPAYPEALYTSALLNRPLEETRLLFSRIAVDYSSSPWADKALYHLALIDYGLNQTDATLTSIKRIFSDYPKSPVIPGAALWGAKAAFQRNEMQLGCDWIRKGLTAVGTDVELKNQLEFTRGRCAVGTGAEFAPPVAESLRLAPTKPPATATATTATSTTTPPPVKGTTPPAKPPVAKTDTTTKPKADTAAKPKPGSATTPSGKWRVQVAAITNKTTIDRAVAQIKKLGFTAYQIKAGATLVKIQAGPFATKEAAQAQVAKLAKAIGGKPFVVQVP